MKAYILISFLSILVLFCNGQPCGELPQSYDSHNEAIAIIKQTKFLFTDYLPAGNSSWIAKAKYYSCDNRIGFLILTTIRGKEYIHKNVPNDIWRAFTKSPSNGSYYNTNIKGRYRLILE